MTIALSKHLEETSYLKTSSRFAPAKNGNAIRETLGDCRVVLAMIGPRWLATLRDRERDVSRPDYVRLELEWAEFNRVQIVPVLIGEPEEVNLPSVEQLPMSLRFLLGIQTARIRRLDFHTDMDRLIEALKKGQLSGHVAIQQSTPEQVLWAEHKDSLDPKKLCNFADTFLNTPESFQARERADRVEGARKRFDEGMEKARHRFEYHGHDYSGLIDCLETLADKVQGNGYLPPRAIEVALTEIAGMIASAEPRRTNQRAERQARDALDKQRAAERAEKEAEAQHRSLVEEDVKRELGPAPSHPGDWSGIFWSSVGVFFFAVILFGIIFGIIAVVSGREFIYGNENRIMSFSYWSALLFFVVFALLKLTHGIRSKAHSDRYELLVRQRMDAWKVTKRRSLAKQG